MAREVRQLWPRQFDERDRVVEDGNRRDKGRWTQSEKLDPSSGENRTDVNGTPR